MLLKLPEVGRDLLNSGLDLSDRGGKTIDAIPNLRELTVTQLLLCVFQLTRWCRQTTRVGVVSQLPRVAAQQWWFVSHCARPMEVGTAYAWPFKVPTLLPGEMLRKVSAVLRYALYSRTYYSSSAVRSSPGTDSCPMISVVGESRGSTFGERRKTTRNAWPPNFLLPVSSMYFVTSFGGSSVAGL